ncbi:MAG: DNA polymerase III subunit gamma/tau [Alphaproteobacteria bacterium]|nr:DNA polymerase III subunit gamma/tau [Alphaproteobacteria bacterium]
MYTPLANKYRPQKFADVVGQDVAVKILTKAILKDRVGHSILFTGTRGVGKTTLARILAKTLRCENRQPNEYEPCGKCESCLNFSKDSQIDVIEIDAASNTGVDDVREIIESCRYKPTTGKYKIFIIDEVHMLSKSAFNALLKTLEEPPEHVKFLMATTEIFKIPETILSRVLRFDLKNVDSVLISQYLSTVCNRENISVGAEALSLVARFANGSIRDSLSILDQILNVADNNSLSAEQVREILCVSDDSDLLELFSLIMSSNLKDSVEKYREIISNEVAAKAVLTRLMDFVYFVTCVKTNLKITDKTLPEESENELRKIAQNTSLSSLSRIWQMLVKGADELKICDRQEIALEMLIIRIIYASHLPDLDEFLKKLTADSFSVSEDRDINSQTSESTSLLAEAMKSFPNAKLK